MAKVAFLLSLYCVSCVPGVEDESPEPSAPIPWTKRIAAVAPDPDSVINWRHWGSAQLDSSLAAAADTPILIYFSAPGCDGLFEGAEAVLRVLIEERYIPIRVNPFHFPQVATRYGNAGWPSLAVLHPDGRLISAATDIPVRNVRTFLRQTHKHFRERRSTIESKLHRAGKTSPSGQALTATNIFAAINDDYDADQGGFGAGPKFPEALVLQFLLEAERTGNRRAGELARHSLDAVLASPLWDDVSGGVYVYSLTADWQTPVYEKDSFDQAVLLTTLMMARTGTNGAKYEERARQLLTACLSTELYDGERGVYLGRRLQLRDGTWWTDPAIYADRSAAVIVAVLRAAALLNDEAAKRKALAAARFLLDNTIDADGHVVHCLVGTAGEPSPGTLGDQFLVALALREAHRWSGDASFFDAAVKVRRWAEVNLLDQAKGIFRDSRPPRHILAWDVLTPFEDGNRVAGNVLAAELYLREGQGERARHILSRARALQVRRSFASRGRILLLADPD